MKNYFYRILLACIITSTFYAQQVNNTEYKTKILQVFQNLDKNRIPHGILLDFGMEFTNLQAFNGTLTDSTYTSSQTITDIYKTLLMCRARQVTTGFITPEEYATRWYSQRAIGVMTLSGLLFKYNKFNDTAYPSKLNYSNNQFSDKFVNSVWQNPYDDKQLFAMTPAVTNFKGLDLKVKLPANLFLSNYPATIQNIQIDFSDGLGFRHVPYDQLINVSYAVANTYTWQYKITLTNNQTLLSHSKVVIEGGLDELTSSATAATGRVNANARTSITGYEKVNITATTPYNNRYGSATLYIRYANNGTTIRKPLIVAEGFDSGVVLNPENEGGDNNVNHFFRNVRLSNSIALSGGLNSYDIIYVDWNIGVDFIQKNAYVLEEVIKYVNTKKAQAGSTTPNVIIGQSMGGLVARYALRDIELNRNFNHDTKLYISHDAPHLGANTPLSVQYSARHLRNLYVTTPIPFAVGDIIVPMIFNYAEGFSNTINFFGGNTSVDTPITPLRAFSLADAPAARQMQYTWVSNSGIINNSVHDDWQQELSNLGYPQGYAGKPIRNIAIANGSECGTTQVDSGNIMSYVKDAGRNTFLSNYIGIMDAVYGTILTRLDIVLPALFPGKSYWEIDFQSKYMTTLNQSKNIYHGSIKYKKKIFWFIPLTVTITNKDVNQPIGVLPYDIYGGGVQRTDNDQLPIANIVSNGFGFIPTASALDIGKGTAVIYDTEYRRSYIGALPPAAPTNSPFQNFVSNFDIDNPNNNNAAHISFNRRNGDWLTSELIANENPSVSPELANCSFICSGTSEPQIFGNETLCASGVFSVPSGATTYTWSITENAYLATLSGNGLSTITLTNNNVGSGYVTLLVTYGNTICGNIAIPKRIWVGAPQITGLFCPDDSTICSGTFCQQGLGLPSFNLTDSVVANSNGLTTAQIFDKTNWEWERVNTNIVIAGDIRGDQIYIAPNFVGQTGVRVRAKNNCGWSEWSELYFEVVDCGVGLSRLSEQEKVFIVYPNPSNDIVNIDVKEGKTMLTVHSKVSAELFDIMCNSKAKINIKNNKASFNVSTLNKGIYVLQIYIDGKTESHQIGVK